VGTRTSTGAGVAGSDKQGAFNFGQVSLDPRIGYSLVARRPGFQPAWLPQLSPDGTPLALQMAPGHRLRGTVVNDATGEPLANLRLLIEAGDATEHFLPQGADTNARGEFDIDTLPPGELSISILGQQFSATAGSDEAIELRLQSRP
jgi:hypothetical protein